MNKNKYYKEVLNSNPSSETDDILKELDEEFKDVFEDYSLLDMDLEDEEEFSVDDYETNKTTIFLTDKEKNDLAEENMALVYYIISKFKNTNIDQDELLSVALIGYEKALSKYNPNKNTKFSTFAYRCIQNEIFYFIRGEKKINEKSISLNATIATDKNGNDLEVSDTIQSEEDTLEEQIIKNETIDCLLKVINEDLDENERLIITRRFGICGTDIMTQNELALMVNMSQANISKKEKNILDKLKKILSSKYKIKNF